MIRDYLVAQLRTLGLRAEGPTGVGAHAFNDIVVVAGRAENIVATLPGRASTGRVVLGAHYDTPTTSPGTSDDKASVAAILEIAVAHRGRASRSDIVLLLSDGRSQGSSARRPSPGSTRTPATAASCSTLRVRATPDRRRCTTRPPATPG